MAIDIFSTKPSSFNLDKNSTFATNLKASITDKLNHYLGGCSDDVLSKYIIVLICNGKDQYEVRDELEAFLGKESKEFVSWLWNYLLESVDRFRYKYASYSEDESGYETDVVVKYKKKRRRRVTRRVKRGVYTSSEDEKVYRSSKFARKSVSSKDKSKGSGGYSQKSDCSLSKTKDTYGRKKVLKNDFSKYCGPTERNCTRAAKNAPSELNVSSEESSERSMLCAKKNKVVQNCRADLALQPVTDPKDMLRGSVWDRLGRQCTDGSIVKGGTFTGEVPSSGISIDADTDTRLERYSKRICGHLQYTETSLNQIQISSISNLTRSKGLSRMSSGNMQTELIPPDQAFGLSDSVFTQDVSEGPQRVLCVEAAGAGITNPTPMHSQLLDMKQRLNQIETKMSTLRAKKLESNKCTPELISSAGVLNHSAKDHELETKSKTNDSQQQRPSDFMTKFKDARFFVIKSYSEDNVRKSITHGVWSSTVFGNKKLDIAYHEAKEKQCPVFLFYSVNGKGKFYGAAEMVGPVDFEKSFDHWTTKRWRGLFSVKWHIVKEVPSSQFRHIILKNNKNQPVTRSWDTQEVELEQGLEMLTILKNY